MKFERDFLDKEHNRLMKALLSESKSLEDVFTVKDRDREGKGKKPLVAALKRHLIEVEKSTSGANLRTVKRVVQEGDSVPVCGENFSYEVLTALFHKYDLQRAPERYLRVPLRLSLHEIENVLKRAGMPRWSRLGVNKEDTQAKQEELLYTLGMDAKAPNRKYVDRVLYRDEKTNKLEYGLVIIGEERTDKEWRASGFASQEAILYTEDHTLAKELAEMGRY